jgi:hypothetical protein
MLRKEESAEGCKPPGSAPRILSAKEAEKACVLCGQKMYFAEEFQVHVCLNKEHGVLAYYGLDECYFTASRDVANRFEKEGRKFHQIEPEVLKAMGVETES